MGNTNPTRDPKKCITLQDFLEGAWTMARESGDIPDTLELDYANWGGVCTETPTGITPKKYRITSPGFDIIPQICYGSNEGIYIDVFMFGNWDVTLDVNKNHRMHIGTIKTLGEGKNDMMMMGQLCGVIAYYFRKFVNSRIDEFDGSGK